MSNKTKLPPMVSVVIVDFDGQEHRGHLLDSLSRQTYRDFEIIWINNGEALELPERVDDIPVKKIISSVNLGFAEGCNLGAFHSQSDFVVFLNNDTKVEAYWLEALLKPLASRPNAGAAISKIVFMPRYVEVGIESPVFRPNESGDSDDRRALGVRLRMEKSWNCSTGLLNVSGLYGSESLNGEVWRWTTRQSSLWLPTLEGSCETLVICIDTPRELCGEKVRVSIGKEVQEVTINGERLEIKQFIEDTDRFDVLNCAGLVIDEKGACLERGIYEKDDGQFNSREEGLAISGCSFLVRKKLFQELGGFDAAFFAYYEDVDLSWRIKKSGWKIFYEPKSVVRHHRSMTSGQQSPFFCFHIYRNKRWNIAKNARLSVALKTLLKELITWIPEDVNRDSEFSAFRLKRETALGMISYLAKRLAMFG